MREINFNKKIKRKMRRGFLWIHYDILEAPDITSSAKLVYMVLARFADNETQECHPSYEMIKNLTGLTENTIKNAIQSLKEKGLIEVNQSPGSVNFYQLNEPPQNLNPLKIRGGTPSKYEVLPPQNKGWNNTNINNTNINISVAKKSQPSVKKKSVKTSKRKTVSYPKKWYDQCISAYQRIKNIKLQGEEYKPVQQALKTMFMSGRKPEDIIRCMEWMNKDNFYKFCWTIRTVQMKLPEFLAGTLDKEAHMSQEELRELYYKTNFPPTRR